MTQEQINRMNDSLRIGLVNPDAQKILDDGWEAIAEFVDSHGHIPNKDFGTIERDKIICMMMDDIATQCEEEKK